MTLTIPEMNVLEHPLLLFFKGKYQYLTVKHPDSIQKKLFRWDILKHISKTYHTYNWYELILHNLNNWCPVCRLYNTCVMGMTARPLHVDYSGSHHNRSSIQWRLCCWNSMFLWLLRPPHRVLKAYQHPPIDCCFITICLCIKPSQTYRPISGWSPLHWQAEGTIPVQDSMFVMAQYQCIWQWNSIVLEGADIPFWPGMAKIPGNTYTLFLIKVFK